MLKDMATERMENIERCNRIILFRDASFNCTTNRQKHTQTLFPRELPP